MMFRAIIFTLIIISLIGLSVVNADPKWATFEVKAEVTGDAYPGQTTPVSIDLIRADQEIGGFDLFLKFDPTVLQAESVEQGSVLTDCGWEYFDWRIDNEMIRIVALANDATVPGSPTCYGATGNIATVYFTVLGTAKATASPIQFYWNDCGDNAMSNIAGDTLFISDEVLNWDGSFVTGDPFTGGAPRSCMPGGEDGVIAPWIEFTHGAVMVTVPTGCDPNGNGVPWELADAIFLTNYIFVGGVAPDPLENGDCNCDAKYNLSDITQMLSVMFRGGTDPCLEEQ